MVAGRGQTLQWTMTTEKMHAEFLANHFELWMYKDIDEYLKKNYDLCEQAQ